MKNNNKKYVLITGASSGIGYELARTYASNNYNLILVARRTEALERLKEEYSKLNIIVIQKDLCEKNAAKAIYEILKEKAIKVQILINNAGIGITDYFNNYDFEKDMDIIQLNIIALTELTKYMSSEMISLGGGKIINVASTGAFQPGPLIAVYYATKAYVLSFSEALQVELKDKNIDVKILCPGATKTEFGKNAGKTDLKNAMDPRKVAEYTFKNMNSKKTYIIPGGINKISIYFSKILPRKFLSKAVFKIQSSVKLNK